MRLAVCFVVLAACGFRPRDAASDAPVAPSDAGSAMPFDAAELVPTCATPGSFQDDFAGTAVGSNWAYVTTNATATVANNMLTATVNDNNPTSGVYLRGRHVVDVTGGAMTIHVGQALPGTGATTVYFARDLTHAITIAAMGSMLTTTLVDGPAPMVMKQIAYNGSQAYWRVREQDFMLYVEVSADQVVWAPALDPVATPSFATTLRFEILAVGGQGMATFSQVDTSQSAAPWCAIDTLHDTFPVGDLLWDNFEPEPPTSTVTGGLPVMPPPPVTCGFAFANAASVTDEGPVGTACYLGTGYAYDLTSTSATIKWGSANTGAQESPLIMVVGDNNGFLGMFATSTDICIDDTNSIQCNEYTFDPSGQDATWTVSEAGGNMSFANANGVLFTETDPFLATATELRLGISSQVDQTTSAVTATFDAVN